MVKLRSTSTVVQLSLLRGQYHYPLSPPARLTKLRSADVLALLVTIAFAIWMAKMGAMVDR